MLSNKVRLQVFLLISCLQWCDMLSLFHQISELESQLAKLRSQLEKGEATRQNLEFELTKCQREMNHQRSAVYDKESELSEVKDHLQGLSFSLWFKYPDTE